ncbi:MAG: hypothetical protein JXA57_15045, partial [Armatimonadetes bacterium]|nr:hypothetical protein [Armatimonadota bacterium]
MRSTQRRRAHAPVEHDIVYSPDLVTPHVKWADPYGRGPIRAFIVGSVHEGRTVVELQQRMSLDARVMSIDPRWDVNKWCIDRYGEFDPLPANDYSKSYKILASEMAAKRSYDVLVMHSIIGWNDIPKQIRQAVHRRVRSGQGLVLVHPQLGEKKGDSDLWDLSPLVAVPPTRLTAEGAGLEEGYPEPPKQALSKKPWSKAADHYLVNGVPFETFPYGALQHYVYQLGQDSQALAVDKDGAPVIAVKQYGKGRVVALA